MVLDEKDVLLYVKTEADLRALKNVANEIVKKLVDNHFTLRLDDDDPFSYPKIEAIKKEYL